jgi:hypothetical protein
VEARREGALAVTEPMAFSSVAYQPPTSHQRSREVLRRPKYFMLSSKFPANKHLLSSLQESSPLPNCTQGGNPE